MSFFNILLVVVICHRVSSLNTISSTNNADLHNEKIPIANEDATPACNTNEKARPCLTQQVFNIYNSGCNEEKPEKPSVEIPKGYIVTPGIGAHKLHLETKKWNDARNTCIKEGGYLSIINSAKEELLFEKLTTENKLDKTETWIGVYDLFTDWVTVSGVPLDNVGYKHWRAGEPNNVGGVEHCVAYGLKAGMNDLECTREYTFICEADLE